MALGRAAGVWSLRHLRPGNSQADRVALYAKALYFLGCFFFFPVLCGGEISAIYSVLQEVAAGRNLFRLEKGRQ